MIHLIDDGDFGNQYGEKPPYCRLMVTLVLRMHFEGTGCPRPFVCHDDAVMKVEKSKLVHLLLFVYGGHDDRSYVHHSMCREAPSMCREAPIYSQSTCWTFLTCTFIRHLIDLIVLLIELRALRVTRLDIT